MIQAKAAPWLSPQVVTVNSFPKVLPAIIEPPLPIWQKRRDRPQAVP